MYKAEKLLQKTTEISDKHKKILEKYIMSKKY